MNARAALLAFALAAAGCLHPVEQCIGVHCPKDGGAPGDGGFDAGSGADAGVYPQTCVKWDGGNVGDCLGHTGYVFDGTHCNGACVLYPIETPGVFSSLRDCATLCAPDHCDQSRFGSPIDSSTVCELLVTSSQGDEVIAAFQLDPVLPDAGTPENGCDGQGDCALADAGYTQACEASLLPSTVAISCTP